MASRSGHKSKTKKPVQTTLGRAAVADGDPQSADLSTLQKPIETSIFGLRQVLTLFETATDEVQRYITYECDIIYECRICRSMYRSLANFILHKRNYCRDYFSPMHKNSNSRSDELEIVQEDEEVKTEEEKIPKKNLNTLLRRVCNKRTSYDADVSNVSRNKNEVVLEKINTNSAGVFQTFHRDSAGGDLMKAEVMEIHNIFASTEAVLGPDGKAISTQKTKTNSRNQNITCTVCNLKFSTKKTLTHHMKYKHNDVRVIYSCPECKDTFANAWCVFRHLYKVHRKNTAQIRKLRDQVHANAIEIKRNFLRPKSPVKSVNINSSDQENQWINDIIERDNSLQRCGGCGKRFERKAALNSHSHICSKRLAVCNTLKKNKRVDIEDNCKRKASVASGAQKRKPKIRRKTKQYVETSTEASALKQENGDETSADCEALNTSNKNKSENDPVNTNETNLATENCVTTEIPEVFEQAVTSNKCDSLNYVGVAKTELESSDTENSFNCLNNENERQLKENGPNYLCTAPKKNRKLTNILEKLNIRSNKNMTRGILSNNNNNETDDLIEKIEDLQNDPDIECRNKNFLDSIKEESLDITVEESKDEGLNFPKSDSLKGVGVSTEFDAKQPNECKDLFSLYDDNSSSLTNSEYPEGQVKEELNPEEDPNLVYDAVPHAGENLNDTAEANSKKRKVSSDEENEMDDLSLEIRSEKYVSAKKLTCLPCNLTFISKSFLIKHMSLHFNWFCFQCSKCSFMSYDRQTCVKHVDTHKIQPKIIENIVLPIPHWKTLNLRTNFSVLNEQVRSQSEGVVNPTERKGKTALTETNKNDPMLRKMIMEVIFGSESQSRGGDEKLESTRPVRNRTSIQKIQKDFVYDMKQLDMKAKETKVKPIKIVKGMDTHFKVVRSAQSNTYKKRRKAVE